MIERGVSHEITSAKKRADILDLDAKLNNFWSDFAISVGSLIVFWSGYIDGLTAIASTFPPFLSGVRLMLDREMRNHRKRFIESHDFNKFVSAKAVELAYQGAFTLSTGGINLRNGDRFRYILLPEPSPMSRAVPYDQADRLLTGLQRHALKEMHQKLGGKKYDTVAIEIPETGHPFEGVYETQQFPRKRSLFAGRESKFKVTNPGRRVAVLTREDFEQIVKKIEQGENPQFAEAIRRLGDPRLIEYLSLFDATLADWQVNRLSELMQKRLNAILSLEVSNHFATPQTSFERTREYFPEKTKVYPQTVLRRQTDSTYQMVLLKAEGIVTTQLNQALGVNGHSLDRLPESTDQLHKARHAYILDQALVQGSLRDLLRPKVLSRDELLREIAQQGMLVLQRGISINDIAQHRASDRWKYAARIGLAILATRGALEIAPLVLEQAGRQLRPVVADITHWIDENIPKTPYRTKDNKLMYPVSETPGRVSSEFAERLPVSRHEWRVTGTLDPSGYYVTATSHVFKNGEWIVNSDNPQKITLPKIAQLPAREYLLVNGLVNPSPIKETRIRIPVRIGTANTIGTEVSVVTVIDFDNKEVDFGLEKYSDGTVAVVLPINPIGKPLSIFAILTPAQTPAVKASGKVERVDFNGLSEQSKKLIIAAYQGSKESGRLIADQLTRDIADSHIYSLLPNKDAKVVKTAQGKIDQLSKYPECTCSICNTGLVLANAAFGQGQEELAIAIGFIGIDGHTAGSIRGGFLSPAASHMFSITSEGRVYDATPGKVSDDPLTQQYIKMLEGLETPVTPTAFVKPEGTSIAGTPVIIETSVPPTPAAASTAIEKPIPTATVITSGQGTHREGTEPEIAFDPTKVGIKETLALFGLLAAAGFGAAKVLGSVKRKRVREDEQPKHQASRQDGPPLHKDQQTVGKERATKEEGLLPRAYNFLGWVLFSDRKVSKGLTGAQNHRSISQDKIYANLAQYIFLDRKYGKLKEYLENPIPYEDKYELSPEERNYVRRLAEMLV